MALDGLSDRDKAVLRSIFDPTTTIGDVLDDSDNFLLDEEPNSENEIKSRELCTKGISCAEKRQFDDALRYLNEGVAAAPNKPSAYNDRAQLLRLMMKDQEAMKDLNRAIDLTTGQNNRTRALALCQRGVLLRKMGKTEDARSDFTEAAKLGSSFARKQVVEMNPYAALCNQMLSQVMRGEKETKLQKE